MASNSHNRTRACLRRRVYWLWGLCLLSVYLVGLPLLPMLALALIWRPGATDTRYESHIRTALRTGGLALVVLLMALVALAVDPLVGMAIAAVMLLWLFVVAWIGLFRTARDRRFPPLLRRRKPQEYPSYGY